MAISLSSIIMDLEATARDAEADLIRSEEVAQRLEIAAEQLFRLAGRVRHGQS